MYFFLFRSDLCVESTSTLSAPLADPLTTYNLTTMRIWTSEHVFNHSWETVTGGQWQKYPNPHNQAVIGTDVVERRVEGGVLYSNRIISSDWGLADWVQKLIGANKVCFAHEYSVVNPEARVMEMHSRNLSFCNVVTMDEKMTYRPHPDCASKTLMHQETVVTVQGVPLTSYMESIIVNTVDKNSHKGKAAIEWVVNKLGEECSALKISSSLDRIKREILELKHTVDESLIQPAKQSIDDLQERIQVDLQKLGSSIAQPVMLRAEEITKPVLIKAEEITKPVLIKAEEITKPVLIKAEEITKPVLIKAEEITKPVLLKAEDLAKVSPVLRRAEEIAFKSL